MENLNIRKRVFENLGDLHYTADVYKIFGDEQKKYRRQFKKILATTAKGQAADNRTAVQTPAAYQTQRFHLQNAGLCFCQSISRKNRRSGAQGVYQRADGTLRIRLRLLCQNHPTEGTGPDKLYYRRHQGHGHLQRQKDTGFHASGNDSADSDVGHEVRQGNRTCHRPTA